MAYRLKKGFKHLGFKLAKRLGQVCGEFLLLDKSLRAWSFGFMLSCYDAELNYDSHTDTFRQGTHHMDGGQ
ncbi:hypothetical protein HHK36_028229 [Tetracentron sinense]|uniref:Uncharacterized protein n=1 Tax=Tetracentron sinense TaxID=13715 RepID=A0A834YJ22_TETSI|nr:hypothetical protein HHK36_028229 [Tetracentron sinense]